MAIFDRLPLVIIVLATATMAMPVVTASAQPAPPGDAIETTQRWAAQGGFETFSLRDISRNIQPPDASPISWRGTGVAVAGHFDRSGLRSAHVVDAVVSRARDFSYASPIGSSAAAASDAASRFDVRYEYRRYLLRDAGFRGLDVGAGLQAIGTRVAFDRHITPVLVTRTRIAGGGIGVAASARLHRWERAQAYVTWVNGEIVSRLSAEHSSSRGAIAPSGGGNWFTDLTARVDWRLSRSTTLSATWRRGYDGYDSNHYHYSARRQALTVGALYAR